MKRIIILFSALFCFSSTCKEEGNDCHLKITIINNSHQDIVEALSIMNTSFRCHLTGSIIMPKGTYEYARNDCWESILANGQPVEIYIVDPSHYNVPGDFYNCDSVEIKNTILKHFMLSLEELKNSNFTIIYP